ncbi:MAG TPA: heme o synthase, partial [Lacipirellulaceae bacterium]|nr:heme o synthase [Lacipirellulaceae bacterium]
ELTKPRIVALELVTVVVAAHLASPWGIEPLVLLHTVLGAALVAASAGAFNQWWERATDARMVRTAHRPLPCGRLSASQVILFGTAALVAGWMELFVGVGLLTANVALATWLVYVLAYTPLKTRSPLNTAVGAVSGSLPILIGWSATPAPIDTRALALVAVMFLWQFPHFMAIAWLYRADYVRGGQRMLTVVDPSGLRAGAQAVVGALALVPVSLVPAMSPQSGSIAIYCGWALALGAAQLLAAVLFLIHRDDRSAKRLLRASLVYLVCWMGLLLMVSC